MTMRRRMNPLRRELTLVSAAMLVLEYTIELYDDDENGLLDSDQYATNNLRKALLPYVKAGFGGSSYALEDFEDKILDLED